ncbi:hypothetical protein E1B28_013557 [Marasmius oreades]|uniref:Uncharacterized protein n=2 Tax=Marasmius oreades TaxID=181124 RepID=A0A9P7UQ08_9AGAR|nr:uncharacterized protein E1B28_013557 [Marasmius oreades]KAG7087604.1 hypothetical protein E1B28_013557 [Marasmius oreades]
MALYAVLFAFTATGALPLGPSEGNVTFEHELTVRADACTPSSRTVLGIVWGCLTTIVACTWLAIHPNVPSPEDSQWRILLRRAMIMALAIVFPEYTTVWAIRQWQEAKRISREMSLREEFPEWTITHSFFLTMGGFMLVDEAGEPRGPLLYNDLSYFEKFRDFKFPSISEREIQDRSKGDALSKALIFLHTSWFLLQVLARPISGLPVTELELVTVAIASLNILAYGFWFKKPLNVECPVKVLLPYWIPHPEGSSLRLQPFHADSRSKSEISLSLATDESFPQVQHVAAFTPLPDSQESLPGSSKSGPLGSKGVDLSTSLEIHSMDITDAFEVESHPRTPSGSTNPMRLNSQRSLLLVTNPLSRVQRVAAFARGLMRRVNVSRRLRHLRLSLSSFTTSLICRVQHIVTFMQKAVGMIKSLRPSRAIMQEALIPGSDHHDLRQSDTMNHFPHGLRVSTFYSGSRYAYSAATSGLLQLLMAVYFGGLHCVAWNFVFQTNELRLLWRVSAITLTSIPLYYMIMLLEARKRGIYVVKVVFYWSGISAIVKTYKTILHVHSKKLNGPSISLTYLGCLPSRTRLSCTYFSRYQGPRQFSLFITTNDHGQ